MLALAATAAGSLVGPLADHDGASGVLARIGVAASAQYTVNLVLITAVIAVTLAARSSRSPATTSAGPIVPFSLMASAALMLVVLWQRSPFLSVALVGPLLAIQLYQRAIVRALRAMRLALTDPLTGLGNHRHFHERLERELAQANERGLPLTLCLVDVDDFKRINDRFGHPAGDRVLSQLAARLRQTGEAFRLGGDEFALLLPGYDETAALTAAYSIVERIGMLTLDQIGSVTVSAGVATSPAPRGRARRADPARRQRALLGEGVRQEPRPRLPPRRDRARGAEAPRERPRPRSTLPGGGQPRPRGRRSQRLHAAATRSASQSWRPASARRLDLPEDQVELTRLAASLHDLGKLAIPEELLRKPGPLTEPERMVLERHPQIGFRMLESLGVDTVADWVLHHHERWDGSGYPDGLPGDQIPLGARIIFVADAFDAMTSECVYRRRVSPQEAVEELDRCAGTQFDPEIVTAFADELALSATAARPPAAALAS